MYCVCHSHCTYILHTHVTRRRRWPVSSRSTLVCYDDIVHILFIRPCQTTWCDRLTIRIVPSLWSLCKMSAARLSTSWYGTPMCSWNTQRNDITRDTRTKNRRTHIMCNIIVETSNSCQRSTFLLDDIVLGYYNIIIIVFRSWIHNYIWNKWLPSKSSRVCMSFQRLLQGLTALCQKIINCQNITNNRVLFTSCV